METPSLAVSPSKNPARYSSLVIALDNPKC
jgi:hypothetical protein